MPCLTCLHTIQNVGVGDDTRRVFWCPRCGAITTEVKTEHPDGPPTVRTEHEPPKIVSRARAFLDFVNRHWKAVPEGQERSLREAATGRAET